MFLPKIYYEPRNSKRQICNSLKIITEIFGSCNADYRILGSVLLVAHTNRVFRRINNVDILLDIKAKECVFEKLKSYGFQFEKKAKAGFSWVEAKRINILD